MTTILLVEDETSLAQVVLKELRGQGYTLLHAGNGRTALELCQQQAFDLVILDWMIPELDGLEVLRCLRQDSPVPVLMLTARADESDRVIGLELGADDYLTKPFGMRELVARVRALLRRAQRIQQTVRQDREGQDQPLVYGALQLDPERRQALADGAPIDLTPTEFDLLHLLLRHPGRVFSREYLSETVWDQVYLEGDRSVDNAIMRLRKKLGEAGALLETCWGVGYRLKKL